MSKKVVFADEARTLLQNGINILANSVKVTLGPKGKNVVLEKQYQTPLITNDGVTIAKEISLENPFENMGADLIKEVSIKTNDIAGDGTTTASILAQAIVKEGNKNFEAGANPIILRKGIQKAVYCCVDCLKKMSKQVVTSKEIEQVATISAGDEKIGKIISDAMKVVGKDGVITIEEGGTLETKMKIVEGMQFDKGYLSPYMCTNNEKMTVEYDNPYILITDKKIESIQEILPILEKIVQGGQKLLIIADDVDGEALATLVLNKLRGTFNAVAVRAPSFGENRKETLEDIAVLTGGIVVSEDMGNNLANVNIEMLGRSKSIKITKDNTTIIGGFGKLSEIEKRKNIIRSQMSSCQDTYEKEQMQNRLAKLSGGVAIVEVGSATEVELKEKKLRIEDALSATKSAMEEGIVAGGGIALIKTRQELQKLINTLEGDEKTGAKIIFNAIVAPIKQIAENSGVSGDVVLETVLQNSNQSFGFDALNLCYGDMFEKGIVDPTKVTRCALENAASVASTILTTECLIAEIKNNN